VPFLKNLLKKIKRSWKRRRRQKKKKKKDKELFQK